MHINFWLAAGVLLLMGCEGGFADSNIGGPVPPSLPFDAGVGEDALGFDTGPRNDAIIAPDTNFELDGKSPLPESLASKDSDPYTVPTEISAKKHLALGPLTAAWLAQGSTPNEWVIRYWDLAEALEPQTIVFPYLANPSGLALGDGWIYVVDDPWGDSDIFGLELATMAWHDVAAGIAGVQNQPTAYGTQVAWRDCRTCVPGADSADKSEIYRRDMATAVGEVRVTDDALADNAPSFGRMTDGTVGLAWVQGYSQLRLLGTGVDMLLPTAATLVETVAVAAGKVIYRASPAVINPDSMIPSPMVINPDSMMPSDVFVLDVESMATVALTVHAEVGATTPIQIASYGEIVAFAQVSSLGGTDARQRVQVYHLAGLYTLVADFEEPNIQQVELGLGAVGIIAPRTDNEGQPDVWLVPIPPSP